MCSLISDEVFFGQNVPPEMFTHTHTTKSWTEMVVFFCDVHFGYIPCLYPTFIFLRSRRKANRLLSFIKNVVLSSGLQIFGTVS